MTVSMELPVALLFAPWWTGQDDPLFTLVSRVVDQGGGEVEATDEECARLRDALEAVAGDPELTDEEREWVGQFVVANGPLGAEVG